MMRGRSQNDGRQNDEGRIMKEGEERKWQNDVGKVEEF